MIKYLIPVFLMLPCLLVAQTKATPVKKEATTAKSGQKDAKVSNKLSFKERKQNIKSIMKIVEDHILDSTDDAHAKQVILGERQLVDHIELDDNGMISADNTKELAEKYLNAKNTKEAYLAEQSKEYAFLMQLRDFRPNHGKAGKGGKGAQNGRGVQNGRANQSKGKGAPANTKSRAIKKGN